MSYTEEEVEEILVLRNEITSLDIRIGRLRGADNLTPFMGQELSDLEENRIEAIGELQELEENFLFV